MHNEQTLDPHYHDNPDYNIPDECDDMMGQPRGDEQHESEKEDKERLQSTESAV